MRLILILFALAILSQAAPGAISTTPEITTYLCCDSCWAPSQSKCATECASCYSVSNYVCCDSCSASSQSKCITECLSCYRVDLCSSMKCDLTDGDKEWENMGYGSFSINYRRKTSCTKKNIDGSCTSVYTYECGCGRYGTFYYADECDTATGDASCKACPDGGKTDAYGTKISDCYLPTGTEISDESGTYEFTSNCHYSSN